jgi:hypothetical protein
MLILVALDGSKPGEHAVAMMAGWARAAGGRSRAPDGVEPDEVHDTFRSIGYAHALAYRWPPPAAMPFAALAPSLR